MKRKIPSLKKGRSVLSLFLVLLTLFSFPIPTKSSSAQGREASVEIFDGAQIRTEGKQGLRFMIKVTNFDVAEDFGIRLKKQGSTNPDGAIISFNTSRKLYDVDMEQKIAYFSVVVVNIPQSSYDVEITAEGYVKNKEQEMHFPGENAMVKRSVKQTAENAGYYIYEDGKIKEHVVKATMFNTLTQGGKYGSATPANSVFGTEGVALFATGDTRSGKINLPYTDVRYELLVTGASSSSSVAKMEVSIGGNTIGKCSFTGTSPKVLSLPFKYKGTPGEQDIVFTCIEDNGSSDVYLMQFDLVLWEKLLTPPAPVPASVGAVSTGNYRNLFKEWGKTDDEIDAKVEDAYNKLFNGTDENYKLYYENGDKAYIYTADTDDVRSEGMSYGMMICLQMDDQEKFNRLWNWADTYMRYKDGKFKGYFKWQCKTDGTLIGDAPAPDGEMYFATALLFASARWGDGEGIYNYGLEARKILHVMLHQTEQSGGVTKMFNTQNKLPVFVPYGNSANHTDPSYNLPAFYEIWAEEVELGEEYWDEVWGGEQAALEDAKFWIDAAKASRKFFPTTIHPSTGLGPDYANFDGSPNKTGDHGDFRFDAWRTAMNIAVDYAWWANDAWQMDFADTIQAFFASKGVTSYGNQWRIDGSQQLSSDHSPGLVACNAVTALAARNEVAWEFVENFWEISMTSGKYRYYDGCLYMMGLLHCSGKFKAYTSTSSGSGVANSRITPTKAEFDKKEDLQADVEVTMTLNGNELVAIQNGDTPLVKDVDYTVNDSLATLKKSYLANLDIGTTKLTFVFSAGINRTIEVKIKESSNIPLLTEYTFDTDVQAEFAPAPSSSTAVRKLNGSNNVLEVKVGTKDDLVILPFELGSKTLADYSQIYVEIAAIANDSQYKDLVVEALKDGNSAFGKIGTNTEVARQSGNAFGGYNSFKGYYISLKNHTSPKLTGTVKLAFGMPNANPSATYQIRVIRLIEK